ncbi:AMP-dependent synthetase/ligase [Neomicrococcus aestuarii]|uniref:Acyl-CoA synthetase n=1 Tax=Neomicrococcus aestuarii TaxID=556325 RepID=A0A1L2ZMQ7_9MICC|nr:AMP-dependent synthetase/ligase [Neomicrococcus aestuarii]APF40497.1 long-chain fatty acid--CoA ligase [Neomicrococcus aestuarii]
MRESSSALAMDLPDNYSVSQLLMDRLKRGGQAPYAVRNPDNASEWLDVSTSEYLALVRSGAKRLIDAGLSAGDSVAIMSKTRFEWTLAEMAVWFAGGITVPIYETSSPYQVEWILKDADVKFVFAETPQRADVVSQAAANGGRSVQIFTFEDDDAATIAPAGETGVPLGAGMAAFVNEGAAARVSDAEVEARRSLAGLQDTATIVYTSGTTGRPKGCEMTHANFCLIAVNLKITMSEVVPPDSRTLMFLPLAHVLARAVQLVCLYTGTQVAHASPATLLPDVSSFKPTFVLAVPRIFEKIRSGATAKAEAGGSGKIFHLAETAAIDSSITKDAKSRGAKRPFSVLKSAGLVAQSALFERLVFKKIRAVLGGEVKFAVSGASELNASVAHFFRGAGIPVLEGYGLTETTAPAAVNMPAATRVGTVGLPIAGTTIRIADNGEVLIKGIGVFARYHNNPEATAAAFDEDGFFKTGDLGKLDDDGFLTITGRTKDLIVTAGGKNVSPNQLEETVRASRIVSQVVVIGENRPFVGALITLDADELASWSKARGLGELSPKDAANNPQVQGEIQSFIDQANATVSKAESIRKYLILEEDFTEESGHLTPSLKLKRHSVMESHADVIEDFYSKK